MSIALTIIAILMLGGAAAAMSLRSLVHCALFAALAFAGLAALFLQLDAQFIGFAQILVYVGAVAILLVFAILLTRGSEPGVQAQFSNSWWVGLATAGIVFVTLAAAVLSTSGLGAAAKPAVEVANDAAVRRIGTQLMTSYVLPLEVLALLLTAALIGAVIVAMQETEGGR